MTPMAKKKRSANQTIPSNELSPAANAAESVDVPTPEAAAATPKQPSWKSGLDFVAMLAGAVVVALLIKAYVMDVYIIPSGSMETALHGRPDGGDRIFSSKLSYRFRKPERWEVAVFKFPYEQARRRDRKGRISSDNDGQNFVKRVVGMPGESMAIGRGDIWVRPIGGQSEYQRVVKPDSVQRGMWLNVYAENFSDLSLAEFQRFWRISGDAVQIERGKGLLVQPEKSPVQLRYRPMLPVGERRSKLLEMPGIPDRYTLEQPIQFRCRQIRENGSECGHIFVKTLATHNIQARCPRCGHLADETEAIFYQRRSGLSMVGEYGVPIFAAPQGETAYRDYDEYNMVPDLRMLIDFTLAQPASALSVTFREDSRFVEVLVNGEGQTEIRINGQPSRLEHRQLSPVRAGRAHKLECYVVEGRVRVFMDGAQEALLDAQIWNDQRPFPRNVVRSSGVDLTMSGGGARITALKMDRDVFYFSGREHNDDPEARYDAMSEMGTVDITPDSFFPMGDHCSSSFDARSWGSVPLNLLLGPALYIWWPPERISSIPRP